MQTHKFPVTEYRSVFLVTKTTEVYVCSATNNTFRFINPHSPEDEKNHQYWEVKEYFGTVYGRDRERRGVSLAVITVWRRAILKASREGRKEFIWYLSVIYTFYGVSDALRPPPVVCEGEKEESLKSGDAEIPSCGGMQLVCFLNLPSRLLEFSRRSSAVNKCSSRLGGTHH